MTELAPSTRPPDLALCWFLCLACHGTGAPAAQPVAVTAATIGSHATPMMLRLATRASAPKCLRCNGLGLELR